LFRATKLKASTGSRAPSRTFGRVWNGIIVDGGAGGRTNHSRILPGLPSRTSKLGRRKARRSKILNFGVGGLFIFLFFPFGKGWGPNLLFPFYLFYFPFLGIIGEAKRRGFFMYLHLCYTSSSTTTTAQPGSSGPFSVSKER